MAGRSVILSAPTSFGKSLVIDAVIASQKYKNVLVVVPTIALIDETRRRLLQLPTPYKVITHPTQAPAERNVFVLTQERALELPDLRLIDFFVIDEFYKLAPGRDGEERASLLNQVFYQLVRMKKPFYLLGPSITGISDSVRSRVDCTFLVEPYHTVVSELHRVPYSRDEFEALAQLCSTLDGPTIVFCQSPRRAAEVSTYLIDKGIGENNARLATAVQWVARNYHPEWHFTRALRNGIGVHHGRIPRALAQFVVNAFDNNDVRFLICTSTMIEGVNTKAQNVVIFDNKINRQKYDYFTFNNIRGRSGRMFKHFVGHVYLFHEPPQDALPFVDVPAFSQSDDAPESLLIQIAAEDLTEVSRRRIEQYSSQATLSFATIKENVGIDPESQLSLAYQLASDPTAYHPALSWTFAPTYAQLQTVCKLIWDHFDGPSLGSGSVRSASQLAVRINLLRRAPLIRDLIAQQLAFEPDPEKSVPNVLDFLRLWAMFHFPRLLRAVGRIQLEVFRQAGLKPGDYSIFAGQVENLFLDPAVVALDEYGIPIELGRRLESVLQPEGNLDVALERLTTLNLDSLELDPFERLLIENAREALMPDIAKSR